jgi:hypothetical protein
MAVRTQMSPTKMPVQEKRLFKCDGRTWVRAGVATAVLAVAACATNSPKTEGQKHPPISASAVRIYREPVSNKYEQIAIVEATSKYSWPITTGRKDDVVIERLKKAAAKLGANAILLEDISSEADPTPGGWIAPDVTRDHQSVGVGIGVPGFLAPRFGHGIAIYVEPP